MKTILKYIIVIIVGVVAFSVTSYIYNSTVLKDKNQVNKPIACTTEAKICSDGSAVGRVGPRCEFAECPPPVQKQKEQPKEQKGELVGHVTIGPFCPVERVDMPCKGPESAYTSREAIVYAPDKVTVKYRTHLDKNGDYKFVISVGKYFVEIAPAGIGRGELKPVTITANATSTINFDIDTGIR